MNRTIGRQDSEMIARLFFRLLPVQVAIIAMGSINSIVDGVVAARFISPSTVGVVGLYYTVLRVLEAAGGILLGGVSVLSGRYLGSGELGKTRGICSLGMAIALMIGTALTLLSFTAPYAIAGLLGANEELTEPLAVYIRGYAIGILPQLLGQQMAANLQLERKEKLSQMGIMVMITANVVLDVVFVAVLKMDVWGLALATSLAYWAYFLVLQQHYFSRDAQLVPKLSLIPPEETLPLLKIGFPNALLVICLAVRSLVINRVLIAYAGSDGLSALSAFNMVSGLLLSVALGTGSLVRMLSSVFFGEDNREGLLAVIRLSLTRVMAVMAAVGAAVVLLSGALAGVFFTDPASRVFGMARELFFIYGFCVPVTLLCIVYSNYCQATGHRLFVNLISLTDGFLSMVIPALLLAPALGATGVWLAFPAGLLITLSVSALYPIVRLRRLPRSLDEWLLLPEEFGTADGLVLRLHDMRDVTRTAESVQAFCGEHGIVRKTGAHAGLCLEEMAGNIVRHGFHMDKKKHEIEVRVGIRSDGVLLRIKDDCIPFNPKEWYEMTSSASGDPTANVGIRLVYGVAEEVSYQNLLGLNVLTVLLSDASFEPARAEAAAVG